MCIAPNQLDDGILVGCRLCWQCKERIIADWAGRCIAESKTSNHTYYITLTYGRDEYGDSGHVRAACLTYSDVQKYFKKIRKSVGKFKYFVVGEYGDENGRAHWHLLMFTQNPLPNEIKYEQNFMEKHWKHGWSYFRHFHPQCAYYCCKYIYKDFKDDLKTALHEMSRKPPLGHEWFQDLAERYVEAGLSPQDLSYKFPDVTRKNGMPFKYFMTRKTAENFLQHFVEKWEERYGVSEHTYFDIRFGNKPKRDGNYIPHSEVVQDYLDKRCRTWTDRSDAFQMKWDMEDRKRRHEQEKQEEADRLAAHERPDTCTCDACVARRSGDPDWWRIAR